MSTWKKKLLKLCFSVQLWKYPITVLTILFALIMAKWFGLNIKGISPQGIEFAQQETGVKLADIESKLNETLAELAGLRKHIQLNKGEVDQIELKAFEAAQTVSDQTAKLGKFSPLSAETGSQRRGFIWIGDYKDKWDRPMLAALDTGQPITLTPEKILRGTEYRVLSNIVVRDGLPQNDSEYFRARKSLGVIPEGTKIRIVSTPKSIDRGFAVQYWAEIVLP